ncbi:ATP synthase subunit I [Pelosinus propionicus]|uniref:ATP synthase I chain n=1 Tax=Pelosinus propionicus DSM 13327 TaxID=1123291 RepID=A0A1I4J900_9FIRM|nr:ATP synthase subunit I [Pelosinus propionicus]SFL62691.1 hypothetical protein SAMN04490355_101165 [Pelosinus propionicus DSM 13327]
MQEYDVEIKKTIIQMIVWGLSICTAAYFTGYSGKIAGLFIGIFTSVIYFLLMGYRIKKSAEMPINRALLYTKIGWIIRLGFIVAMMLLSIKLPGVDFWSAVFGLFTLQIILFLQAVVLITKSFFVKS